MKAPLMKKKDLRVLLWNRQKTNLPGDQSLLDGLLYSFSCFHVWDRYGIQIKIWIRKEIPYSGMCVETSRELMARLNPTPPRHLGVKVEQVHKDFAGNKVGIKASHHDFLIVKNEHSGTLWLVDPTWQQFVDEERRIPSQPVLIIKLESPGHPYRSTDITEILQHANISDEWSREIWADTVEEYLNRQHRKEGKDRSGDEAMKASVFPYTKDPFEQWRQRELVPFGWYQNIAKLVRKVKTLMFRGEPDYPQDSLYFKEYSRQFKQLNEEESRIFLLKVLLSHFLVPKTNPFTWKNLLAWQHNKVPVLFYKEIKDILPGYNLFQVTALTRAPQTGTDITEFYLINGVYVGYGVALFGSSYISMGFQIFENPDDPRFGRGKVPGLSKAILKERLNAYKNLIPQGQIWHVRIPPNQYKGKVPRFYLDLGFQSKSGQKEDYSKGLFLDLSGTGKNADLAMTGKRDTGGIDLTPANMNLQTKMDSRLYVNGGYSLWWS